MITIKIDGRDRNHVHAILHRVAIHLSRAGEKVRIVDQTGHTPFPEWDIAEDHATVLIQREGATNATGAY